MKSISRQEAVKLSKDILLRAEKERAMTSEVDPDSMGCSDCAEKNKVIEVMAEKLADIRDCVDACPACKKAAIAALAAAGK